MSWRRVTLPPPAVDRITHGFAGSGKTTLSQRLLESVGAVRIRTDVERKRLHGLDPAHDSTASIGSRLYTPEATRDTYLRALSLTRKAAAAGYPAIVDGAFLSAGSAIRSGAGGGNGPTVVMSLYGERATWRVRSRGGCAKRTTRRCDSPCGTSVQNARSACPENWRIRVYDVGSRCGVLRRVEALLHHLQPPDSAALLPGAALVLNVRMAGPRAGRCVRPRESPRGRRRCRAAAPAP